MSKPCPRCGKSDFVVQTPGVFPFDGERITSKELRCDIEENVNSSEFDSAVLHCNACEWEGNVFHLNPSAADLIKATFPQPEQYDAGWWVLLEHIRMLENKLHTIENAIDSVEEGDGEKRLLDSIELVRQACPMDDIDEWMINPRCPDCGHALERAAASMDPTAGICRNCNWVGYAGPEQVR
jgi:hypothetical protein